jgi:hypothetical protein
MNPRSSTWDFRSAVRLSRNSGPVEARADEPGREAPLVEQAHRHVELQHLRLVGEGVASREDDDLLVGQEARAPGAAPGRRGRSGGTHGRRPAPGASRGPRRDELAEGVRRSPSRRRPGAGSPVPHRVGEAVRPGPSRAPRSPWSELRDRPPGKAGDEVSSLSSRWTISLAPRRPSSGRTRRTCGRTRAASRRG